MRKIYFVLIILPFVFCGCKPSEADIQKAIAQTQTAAPTSTLTPTLKPTFTSTPSIRLSEIVFSSQDLLDFSRYYTETIIDITSSFNTPDYSDDFFAGRYIGTGGMGDIIIYIIKYDNKSKANAVAEQMNFNQSEDRVDVEFKLPLPENSQLELNDDGVYILRFSQGTILVMIAQDENSFDLSVENANTFFSYVGWLQMQKIIEAGY